MDEAIINKTLNLMLSYLETLGEDDHLQIHLLSGATLTVKGNPGQDSDGLFIDVVNHADEPMSIRLDQIAAIENVSMPKGAFGAIF